MTGFRTSKRIFGSSDVSSFALRSYGAGTDAERNMIGIRTGSNDFYRFTDNIEQILQIIDIVRQFRGY